MRRESSGGAAASGVARRRRRAMRHRAPGHLDLGRGGRAPGQLLDRVAVAVAGREVHLGERAAVARGASSTRLTLSTNSAQSNHEMQAHARDHVADRHVHRAWRWCSRAPSPRRSVPRPRGAPPASERGRDRRVLIAQALEELDRGPVGSAAARSRAGHGRAGSGLAAPPARAGASASSSASSRARPRPRTICSARRRRFSTSRIAQA